MSTTTPDVSVIIVNWNVAELIDVCLRTLHEYTACSLEVIVVDNASSDNSVSLIKERHPWVKLIASPDNLGFTRGNNRGLQDATGRHILFLNPDIELIEDAITPMLAYLEEHSDVGVVGCKLLNTDHSYQHSIGGFPTLKNLLQEYYQRHKMYVTKEKPLTEPTEVGVVLGACLLCRGEAVRQLGGFDERYFMYLEETDLCLSLKEMGLMTVYYPLVSMIHHGSKSSQRSVESWQRSLAENRKSQVLFYTKHYSAWIAFCTKAMIGLALSVRIPILFLQGLLRKSKSSENHIKITYYTKTLRWMLSHPKTA